MRNIEKYLNKFYDIVDKIGKHNFILIIFIFIALITTSLYQTFSLYTESEGLSILDGIETYSFILNNDNTTNSVTIAAGNTKYLDITVHNISEESMIYGLYYSSSSDLTDVSIGYLTETKNLPNGTIDGKSSYIVTIRIDNNSDNNITINFGVKYGFENSDDLVVDEGENWLSEYVRILLLSEVDVGSYVSYIGANNNNGSNTTDNYCYNSSHPYVYSGWRIAYHDNEFSHLVTGGAPECIATEASSTETGYVDNVVIDNPLSTTESWTQNSYGTTNKYYYGSSYSFDSETGLYSLTGTTGQYTISMYGGTVDYNSKPYTCKSTSSASDTCETIYKLTKASSSGFAFMGGGCTFTASSYTNKGTSDTIVSETSNDLIDKLNNAAILYCNADFAYDGLCNSSSVWAITGSDYNKITGNVFTNGTSAVADSNGLIGNGGLYWFANYSSDSNLYLWDPSVGYINNDIAITSDLGLRPIIKLDSSVFVTGGSGTKDDPYTIGVNKILDSVSISAGESENITLSVPNLSGIDLLYDVYYTSISNLAEVDVGYLSSTPNLPNGTVSGDDGNVVKIRIDNNSDSDIVIDFGVKYRFENEGDNILNDDENQIVEYDKMILLSSVDVGSYVSYTGVNNNSGTNVSDNYCYNSSYTYDYSGWRVAYHEGGHPHLITGGAPECIGANPSSTVTTYTDNVAIDSPESTTQTWSQSSTTNRYYYGSSYSFDPETGLYSLSGTTGRYTVSYTTSSVDYTSMPYTCKKTSNATDTCETIYKLTNAEVTGSITSKSCTFTASSYTNGKITETIEAETSSDLITKLNDAAIPYCNTDFSYNGVCDSSSVWAVTGNDYNKITGNIFTSGTSAVADSNGLIGNGGFYWLANSYSTTNSYLWDASVNYVNNNLELTNPLGLRPIIKLDSSVYIIDGNGTVDDPYIIAK